MLARSLSLSFSGVATASVLARSAPYREGVLHRSPDGVPLEPGTRIALVIAPVDGDQRLATYAFADPQSAVEHARSFDGVPVPNPFEKDDR